MKKSGKSKKKSVKVDGEKSKVRLDKYARGGKVPQMTAGALSGKGRLQKTEIQKNKD